MAVVWKFTLRRYRGVEGSDLDDLVHESRGRLVLDDGEPFRACAELRWPLAEGWTVSEVEFVRELDDPTGPPPSDSVRAMIEEARGAVWSEDREDFAVPLLEAVARLSAEVSELRAQAKALGSHPALV